MASLQLTATRKSDALAILKDISGNRFFTKIRLNKSLVDKLEAAGDTDNMTCDVDELQHLKDKIVSVRGLNLSSQEETDLLDLGTTVQAAIDA